MQVSQTNSVNQIVSEQLNKKTGKADTGLSITGSGARETEIEEMFQLSEEESIDAAYKNPKMAMDSAVIEKLMKETDDIKSSIKSMVRDLLERQGYTVDQLKSGQDTEIKVDETARAEAQKLIGPGGELSAEKVSDRIVDFAIAAFGGDKSKIGIIRDSIDRGFAEAKKMLGGKLSDVSNETYDLIQKRLDEWVNGTEGAEE